MINATHGRSFIVFRVDHMSHRIDFTYEGCDPLANHIWDLCLTDPDIRKEVQWGMQVSRVNSAYISEHTGYSGCRDICLSIVEGQEGLNKYLRGSPRVNVHISMYGKVQPRGTIWSGDLAPILYFYCPFKVMGSSAYISYSDGSWSRISNKCKYLQIRSQKYGVSQIVTNYFEQSETIDIEKEFPKRRRERRSPRT